MVDFSSESSTVAASRRPLVLVADDIPENVELLSHQLSDLGYDTLAAYDATTAVELCIRHRPDLCILDIAMPAGSLNVDDRTAGFEVCRILKKNPYTHRIPVIFVTALNDTSDRILGIEAGGDDFLPKPHNRQILKARVKSLLKLKATSDALELSYEKLRELERIRDDLIKMVIHDLKTPLTGVLASLEMIVDGNFGSVLPEQKRVLKDAQRQSEDLLALIGDLLEVSKLEEASMSLNREVFNAQAFVQEVIDEWRVRFEQDSTRVSLDLNTCSVNISADKQLLKRVFSNIIQNALTHSDREIELLVTGRVQKDANAIVLSISDNGVGIAPEYHEVIFQKFAKIAGRHVPRNRSSGLGLAFCKLVAEAHGGKIWVESELNAGSTFFVLLPTEQNA